MWLCESERLNPANHILLIQLLFLPSFQTGRWKDQGGEGKEKKRDVEYSFVDFPLSAEWEVIGLWARNSLDSILISSPFSLFLFSGIILVFPDVSYFYYINVTKHP